MLKRCLEDSEKLSIDEKRQLKKHDREQELDDLCDYICKEWETCCRLRQKIDNEGSEYFYNQYTSVPVSWKLFCEFYESEDCYCGTEGGCLDSEEEDEEEFYECTCINEPSDRKETPCCYFPLCAYCYQEQVKLEYDQCGNTKMVCDHCRGETKSCGCLN